MKKTNYKNSIKILVLLFALMLFGSNVNAKAAFPDIAFYGTNWDNSLNFTAPDNLPMAFGSVTIISPNCYNSNNGSIQLFVSGGVSPYTYLWNNGQTTCTTINLMAGYYTVTVTDEDHITLVGSWQVTAPPAMSIDYAVTNILCSGNNTGKIDITVNGGAPSYSYNWNVIGAQGKLTPHVSMLYSGSYTVTVTDNNLCTKIQSWFVAQPVALSGNGFVTNVTCIGANNGTARLSGLGGTPPYSYKWNTGSTAHQITGLSAGQYSVTMKDANNCVNFTWQTITQPSDIIVTGTPVNVTCQGYNTGMITTTVSGGSGGATTYLWNNGQTGSTAINLPVGTYTVTVTNGAGCSKTHSFAVTENPGITFGPVAVIPANCYTSNNGSIQLFVSGGVTPYTYLWNNGQTGGTAVNLGAGTYTVTVANANLCTKVGSWQVTSPPAMSIDYAVTDILCSGNNNGKIDITVNGGSPSYSYNWNVIGSQGKLTPHVSMLYSGSYTVTVTDNNLCAKIQSWFVAQPVALSGTGFVTNITCYGANNGTATLSGLGGTPPYSYMWNTGSTAHEITGLSVGQYSVTMKDAHNCVNFTWQTITQPSDITFTGTPVNVTCQGYNTGMITTTVSGGSGGTTTYLWNNGQTGSTAVNLPVGTYTVTVTNGAGCTKTQSFEITENPGIAFGPVAIIPATCYTSNNGSIQLFVNGGVSPYTYLWNNGQTGGAAVNLGAGTYTVTVTNANLCTKVGSWQVTSPPAMSIDYAVTNILCNGNNTGKIDITVNGGSPSYSYNWNVIGYQGKLTPHVSMLYSGSYTVTVTDNNLCTKIQSWFVAQPVALSGTGFVTNISCYGANNGTASLSGLGGTPPYSYKWNTGSTAHQITGLSAGQYSVTMKDANNCVNFTWQTITQPTAMSISGTPVNVICQGCSNGEITTTISGGSGGATTYLWNNGQTGSTAVNLPVGIYTVTVTNGAGCTNTHRFEISDDSPLIFDSVSIIPVTCYNSNNGSVRLSLSGGHPPYTYLWNNGQTAGSAVNLIAGVYSVTVTDSDQMTLVGSWPVTAPSALSINYAVTNILCNGNNNGKIDITVAGGTPPYSYNWNLAASQGQGTPHASNLGTGTYTVTVSDNNLCTKIQNWIIDQPVALSVNCVVTNITCYGANNGTAMTAGLGGTAPYSYQWSTGSTAQLITGLSVGRYYVTIKDANNCVNFAWQDITAPNEIAITGTPSNVICHGGNNGQVTTTVTGGTSGYSYKWNNNQITPTAVNLTAGIYIVTVTDYNTCSVSQIFEITEHTAINIIETGWKEPTCFTSNNGYLTVSVSGGTGSFQYAWSSPGGSTPSLTGLASGAYTVTVTDGNNCTKTASWHLEGPSAMTIASPETHVLCNEGNDGKIDLLVTGGTAPYSYNWPKYVDLLQRTLPNITGLVAGGYLVFVTDAHSCMAMDISFITQPSEISISYTVIDTDCSGATGGTITTTVSGGSGGATTYLWSNGQTGSTATNLPNGIYTVTVTNEAGCTASSGPISVGQGLLQVKPADPISGPEFVGLGQTGVVYSVLPIENATGYVWSLPPGAVITGGSNTATITVDFSVLASSGSINVYGFNDCGFGPPSDEKNIIVIPMVLNLENGSLGQGEDKCYNAIQTIYVAGGSSTFTINSGASVTMIAGQNIIYLPGTTVNYGGYMLGKIAADNEYCNQDGNPVVNNPIQPGDVQESVVEMVKNRNIRAYPNPTSGPLTIELTGTSESGMTKVEIFGMNGIKVMSEYLTGERQHTLSTESLRPGMYFLHVSTGATKETMKLIKL